jgi:hypothetical protein
MAFVGKNFIERIWGEINRFPPLNHRFICTPRQAIEQWCRALGDYNLSESKGEVLITAIRNYTWIEWSVYAAFVFRQKGYNTTLLFRSSEVEKLYPESKYLNFWTKVESLPFMTLLDLDKLDFDPTRAIFYQSELKGEIKSALAYNFHVESENIDLDCALYDSSLAELNQLVGQQAAKLEQLLIKKKYRVFLCFSGLINETPGLLRAARYRGVETACIEGWGWRQGHMIYHFNSPALEYNIKGWMNYLGPWNDAKEQEIEHYFNFLEKNTKDEKWLSEVMKVQQANVDDDMPSHIREFVQDGKRLFVLACNVVGDSSMLNRETIFASQQQLIRGCIDYFKQRPDLKLIIRAHPGETVVAKKVGIFMGEFSEPLVEGIPNILVVHNYEKLNTFSLVPYTAGVICWISSVAVDMIIRGVPAVVTANPKYAGLGIVDEPQTQDEFFQWIKQVCDKKIVVTERQMQVAKEYLYLIFKGFSFEAFGKKFRSFTCKLNQPANKKSHDEFYQILLREILAPDETGVNV